MDMDYIYNTLYAIAAIMITPMGMRSPVHGLWGEVNGMGEETESNVSRRWDMVSGLKFGSEQVNLGYFGTDLKSS